MGKIAPQLLKLLDIKKVFYFLVMLASLALLSACTYGNAKDANKEAQTTDAAVQKLSSIAYTEYPLAYLVDSELFFHSLADNKK